MCIPLTVQSQTIALQTNSDYFANQLKLLCKLTQIALQFNLICSLICMTSIIWKIAPELSKGLFEEDKRSALGN